MGRLNDISIDSNSAYDHGYLYMYVTISGYISEFAHCANSEMYSELCKFRNVLRNYISFQSPFNEITYDMIGDDATPTYFSVDSATGLISLRDNTNLEFDSTTLFVARIRATDGGYPSRQDTATVRIEVLRNLFSPVYNHSQNIQVTILETAPIGTFIYDLDAYDNDRAVSEMVLVIFSEHC